MITAVAGEGETQHNTEIHENMMHWQRKPLLHLVYREFYRQIASFIRADVKGSVVELGSGTGNLKMAVPDCICTDIFPNPWIDQVENAYQLSFADNSVSNLILFDVFHHLQFPGSALNEFGRVLPTGGRVILFEPAMGWLGRLVFGLFHHEPLEMNKEITWKAPKGFDFTSTSYYAAQGNAHRVFNGTEFKKEMAGWKLIELRRYAALSYVASGGYRGRQLYPAALYPLMKTIDSLLSMLPVVFATRMLVVLEKQ